MVGHLPMLLEMTRPIGDGLATIVLEALDLHGEREIWLEITPPEKATLTIPLAEAQALVAAIGAAIELAQSD